MKKNIVIYGSSYPDSIEVLKTDNEVNIIGYVNDFSLDEASWMSQINYLGNHQIIKELNSDTLIFNNIWSHNNRKLIYQRIMNYGLDVFSYFSDDIFIPNSSKIGKGNWMHKGVKIGSEVRIGNNCGIRFNTIVNHECSIGSHSFLGPGVVLSGRVSIGENSFIGSGAIILPNICIGDNVIVGAGSVVTKNVVSNSVVFGNPAKVSN